MYFDDTRIELLELLLHQRSIQTGGIGFTSEDFDEENELFDNEFLDCPGSRNQKFFIIPYNNVEIFPGGSSGRPFFLPSTRVFTFFKRDWWEFMLVGLRRIDPSTGEREPVNSDGFLRDYNYEDWGVTFPQY